MVRDAPSGRRFGRFSAFAMASASSVNAAPASDAFYCIAFPDKIKEIFSLFADFFAQSLCPAQGNGGQVRQKRQRIHPEIPHRPQGRERRRKNSHAAAPIPSSTYSRSCPWARRRVNRKTEPRRPRSRGSPAAPSAGGAQADGPQQIIYQPGGHPSRTAWQKVSSWGESAVSIAAHPNRRRKKPPRSSPPSS